MNQPGQLAARTFHLQTSEGLDLFGQRWETKSPQAVVVIIHGFGEHIGRYEHVAQFLARHRLAVLGYDLRGHGRSQGQRVYVESFDEHLDDLGGAIAQARQDHPSLPLFLFGHSMGGTIVALYAIERELSDQTTGLIFSGAAIKLSDDISPFLQAISGALARLLPHLPTIKVEIRHLSRRPEIVRAYDEDPLVFHGGTPARMGAEFVRAMQRIQASMGTIALPLLIHHGTADRLSDPEGSRMLYAGVSSQDKTLHMYEGLYHELHNEPEQDKVLQDMVEWMVARI